MALTCLVPLELIGPLGGAIIALLGVVVGLVFNARQKRRDYRQEFLVGLVKNRYSLYCDYVDVLRQNVDLMSGENAMELDEAEVLKTLHSLESRMRIFATKDVLEAFEVYRSCLREIATNKNVDPFDRHKLLHEIHVAEALSLSMIRADLEVDAFDNWWRRHRRLRRVESLMSSQQENFDKMKKWRLKQAEEDARADSASSPD